MCLKLHGGVQSLDLLGRSTWVQTVGSNSEKKYVSLIPLSGVDGSHRLSHSSDTGLVFPTRALVCALLGILRNEQKALNINTETSPVGGLQLSWLPQGSREKP